ncbi:MAG: TIGR00269 family protein, partial [Methanobacterium sp.]|nr:TIGR00269 family protein [Methanobacterium sp.]
FLKQLSENHPTIMYSTLSGFEKIKSSIKQNMNQKVNTGNCKNCGEPASGELCKACIFLEQLKQR